MNAATEKSVLIGEKMSMDDFNKARASVEGGSIYQPKPNGEYSGKIVMWTDSHVVQKVGSKTAVVHDLKSLDKESQASLVEAIKTGKISSQIIKVEYDETTGKSKTFTYAQDQVNKTAKSLEKAIANSDKTPEHKAVLLNFVKEWNENTNKALSKEQTKAPEIKQEQKQAPAPKR